MKRIITFLVSVCILLSIAVPMIGGSNNQDCPRAFPILMKNPFPTDITDVAFYIVGVADIPVDAEVEVGVTPNFPIGAGSEGVFTTTEDNYVTGVFRVSCFGFFEGTPYYYRVALTNGTNTLYFPGITTTDVVNIAVVDDSPSNPLTLALIQDRPTNTGQSVFLCTLEVEISPGLNTWPLSAITEGPGAAGFVGDNLRNPLTGEYYQTVGGENYLIGAWGMWDDGSGMAFWANETYEGIYIGNPDPFAEVKTESGGHYPSRATSPVSFDTMDPSPTITYRNCGCFPPTSIDIYYSDDNGFNWVYWDTDPTPDWNATLGEYEWVATSPLPGSGTYYWSVQDPNREGIPTGLGDKEAGPYVYHSMDSYINLISPYWDNLSPRGIGAIASDPTGIAKVTLWFRISSNNLSWNAWTPFGIDDAEPWFWDFNFPNGEGYYEFFSLAINVLGETEPMKILAEARCGYDISAPFNGGFIPPNYWTNENPFTISSPLVDDLSGMALSQELWYNYSSAGWVFYGFSMIGIWSFNWPGEGNCEFIFIGSDVLGNSRSMPGISDLQFGYDYQAPITMTDPIPPFVLNPIQLNATGVDYGPPSGINYLELWYSYEGGAYVLFDSDSTAPYEWLFDFPEGVGYYEFISRGMDNAGNYETKHPLNDTWCWCGFIPSIPWDIYNGQTFVTFTNDITPGWTSEDLAVDLISYININYPESLANEDVEIFRYDSVTGLMERCFYWVAISMWWGQFALVEGDTYIVQIAPGALSVQPRSYELPNSALTSPVTVDIYNGMNFRGFPVTTCADSEELAEDLINYINANYGESLVVQEVEIFRYNSVTGLMERCFNWGEFGWWGVFPLKPNEGYIIQIAPGALSVQPRAYTPS